jgi:hypothetical protein
MRDCPQTPGWGATCGTFVLVLLVFRVREFARANGLMEPTRSCNRCLRGTAELDWVVDFEPESHIRRDLQSTLRPMPRSQLGRMRLNAIPFLGNEHNDVAFRHVDGSRLRHPVGRMDCRFEVVTSAAGLDSDSDVNLPRHAGMCALGDAPSSHAAVTIPRSPATSGSVPDKVSGE